MAKVVMMIGKITTGTGNTGEAEVHGHGSLWAEVDLAAEVLVVDLAEVDSVDLVVAVFLAEARVVAGN